MPDTEVRKAAERVPVMVRLPRDLVRELDHMAVDKDVYRQQLIEELIRKGLREERG